MHLLFYFILKLAYRLDRYWFIMSNLQAEPETQCGIISYLITREQRLVTWPTELTCRDYSSTSFSHLSTNVGGATDVSQVLALIMDESWGHADVLYFLRDYRVYRGCRYENESLLPSCWEQEQRPGHHTMAHAGLCLWGWKGFGEEMTFQSQESSRYTRCIKSPSPGACAKAQKGKAACVFGEFQSAWLEYGYKGEEWQRRKTEGAAGAGFI